MDALNVKFGTPAPIGFREYDKDHPQIDLELEVRFAGLTVVSAYDEARYGSSEAVAAKVRETALASLTEQIRTWPAGQSFWKNTTRAALERHLDGRLAACGITAKTELFSFALTEESRALYDAAVKDANKSNVFVDILSPYQTLIDCNEGQPRTGTPLFDGFSMDKNPFTPSSDDRGAGIVPNGSPITTSTDKYCRFCGAKREDGAKFCAACGKKFA